MCVCVNTEITLIRDNVSHKTVGKIRTKWIASIPFPKYTQELKFVCFFIIVLKKHVAYSMLNVLLTFLSLKEQA